MTHWDDRLIGAISLAAKRHMVAGTRFTIRKLPELATLIGKKVTKRDWRARNGQNQSHS